MKNTTSLRSENFLRMSIPSLCIKVMPSRICTICSILLWRVAGYQRDLRPLPPSPFLTSPAPGARMPPRFTRFLSIVLNALSRNVRSLFCQEGFYILIRKVKVRNLLSNPHPILSSKERLPDSSNIIIYFHHDDMFSEIFSGSRQTYNAPTCKRFYKMGRITGLRPNCCLTCGDNHRRKRGTNHVLPPG